MVSGETTRKIMTETQTPSVIVEASAIEKNIYQYIYRVLYGKAQVKMGQGSSSPSLGMIFFPQIFDIEVSSARGSTN